MWRLMLCGVVSWLVLNPSAPLWADDAEDKAVAFVEKLGGNVARDEKLPGKPVIEVHLSFSAVTDVGLKELAPLENLTALFLLRTEVTDTGLKELAQFKNLTVLYLNRTQVTDAGLKEVALLKNLAELHLPDTQVTDTGLKELAPLKNLTTLNLSYTQVTDAGLKELAPLKNLTKLYLRGTQVTDPGLEGLAPLKNLTTLHLNGTNPSWTRADAAEGHFRALFPEEPKRSKTADPLGFVYKASIPGQAVGFYIFFTPNIDTRVSLDTRLTASQDSTKSSRNAQRRSIDICGYAGKEMTREYTDANHTVVSRQRIFYAGKDMYQLMVLAVDRETFPEEDANHFFSGFELLKESKKRAAP
jgi:hypothetical protein